MDDTEIKLKALDVLIKGAHWFVLNMNDTFAHGCSDTEDMYAHELEVLFPIIAKYGPDAFTAYAALRRNQEPVEEFTGPEYQQAKIEMKAALDNYYEEKKRKHEEWLKNNE